ncbi:PREDICTED: ethylene-responsive transcription factor WRI1-like [Tarenaya hassleriana]|uniref:ethylene-responsive transcription factor WRI1-like n=1 Tax=Tarenaya hassleriana TaxID=28532 RepID=UPI00053C8999|nr:PREDICTED: ethylene-responsive transcription factor WRI1-like [Tarenaya hassleriana]
MAAIEYRGANAVTNFDISNYVDRLKQKGVFPFPLNQIQEPVVESSAAETEQETGVRKAKAELPQQEEPEQEEEEYEQYLQQPNEEERQEQDIIEEFQTYKEDVTCCMDSSTIMEMDPSDNNKLAWSFCADIGFAPFLTDQKLMSTDEPIEFPELLDEMGFEENIDFMFEDAKPDLLALDNPSCCGCLVTAESPSSSLSPSFSSSSESTTTSVSCNYSV